LDRDNVTSQKGDPQGLYIVINLKGVVQSFKPSLDGMAAYSQFEGYFVVVKSLGA
jgi:hypothetical protein